MQPLARKTGTCNNHYASLLRTAWAQGLSASLLVRMLASTTATPGALRGLSVAEHWCGEAEKKGANQKEQET